MSVWILHGGIEGNFITLSSDEIKEHLTKLNVDVSVFNYNIFKFQLSNGIEELYYCGSKITHLPKVVFARGNCYKLMHYLKNRNVKIINSFIDMIYMKDKWQTYLNLNQIGIAQPDTIYSTVKLNYNDVVEKLGTPFVVKYRFGSQGKSVYLINNDLEYEEVINKYYFDDLIMQKYISTSFGKDVRVFVIGDSYHAVVRDNTMNNNFKSNLAQGGISYKFELPFELKEEVKQICTCLNAEIVGLDFLFGADGKFLFCEANGNPGYKSFEDKNVNISKLIAEYIYNTYFKG